MPTCFGDELCVHAGAALSNNASMVPEIPTHHECQPSFVTVLYYIIILYHIILYNIL
jgi:hypothetical protein